MTIRVAAAGIDGAGKSTLLRRLMRWPPLEGAVLLKKEHRAIAEMLLRLHRSLHTEKGQLTGSVAAGLRWAHTLDFLHHWEHCGRAAFEGGGPVLLDRWKLCFEAGAGTNAGLGRQLRSLLDPVPEADLILFLDIDPTVAHARLATRGPLRPDEGLNSLKALRHGYEAALAACAAPVYILAPGDEFYLFEQACLSIERYLASTAKQNRAARGASSRSIIV